MFNATKHNIRPFHIHVFVNMSDCNILFITEIIKFNLKIRQSMLRTAEPKDETPGGVPFIIGESHDIENDCILSPPFFIGIHPITVSSITKFGRFCGAIHSVDWACISVLSQVIHSVNERKTVQINMISFVSHGDKTL